MAAVNSYIYIVKDHKNRCYVGQSTQLESTGVGSIQYHRIYEHYYNVFYDAINDASLPLFQDWPLKYLDIEVYPADGAAPYGLSMDTYRTFTKYFIKKGGTKRNYSKENKEIKTFLEDTNETLKITSTDNAQETFKSDYMETADMIDIAEIIWISRMQYAGYQVLNKVIGGQQSGWIAVDASSQKNLFNINNTTPEQLTSFLIATSEINKNRLNQAQQDLDKIFDKYLRKNIGELIVKRVNKHKDEIKKSISGKQKMSFADIVLKEVQEGLSGKTSKKVNGIQEDLNKFIESYPDLNIREIDWTLKSKDKELDLFQLITRIIAQSILGPRQNMTLYKDSTEGELTLNYNNGGRMTFKGYQGKDIGSNNAQVITIPLEQALSISKNADPTVANWWYNFPRGEIVDSEVKFVWARQVFKNHFRKGSNRIADASMGVLKRVQDGDFVTEILINGDTALIAKKVPQNKLLSVKMLNEYRQHLTYNNDVLNAGNWHRFFSAMYASISNSEWELNTSEDGSKFAILSNSEREVQREDGVFVGVVGIKLTQGTIFVTDKNVAKNVIF